MKQQQMNSIQKLLKVGLGFQIAYFACVLMINLFQSWVISAYIRFYEISSYSDEAIAYKPTYFIIVHAFLMGLCFIGLYRAICNKMKAEERSLNPLTVAVGIYFIASPILRVVAKVGEAFQLYGLSIDSDIAHSYLNQFLSRFDILFLVANVLLVCACSMLWYRAKYCPIGEQSLTDQTEISVYR